MWLSLAVLLGLTSHAIAAPTLRFTKGPDDKYRCSRYAPAVSKSEALRVFAPPGKPMVFSFAAVASDRSAVKYRAEGLPSGARVDAQGKFAWAIPVDANGTWTITLVAETTTGGKSTSSFTLAIAEPDLVVAWRSGMGSYEPDCTQRISRYFFRDLDGDGKTDLVYTTGDQADDSANQGSYVTHVRLRTGDRFDPVPRTLAADDLDVVTLPDGKPAVVVRKSCCCMADIWIVRLTAAGADELLRAGGTECRGYRALEVETNANGHVHRVVTRSGGDTPSIETWSWRNGSFVRK